jgi:type IV secretion system protein TrbJ
MKKRVASLLLLGILLFYVRKASAILGIGDVVFDPSVYAQTLQQVAQLTKEYAQLVDTYEVIERQYESMVRMAQQVPVNMITRYRAAATPWTPSSANNTLGTTAGWTQAIDAGQNVAAGYSGATQKLDAYGSTLDSLPTSQQDRVKTGYATVELTDGANVAAMQTIGQLRANAPAVESAIRNLENDSLSSDPSMNTEIAVLNKVNAANLIAVRNSQDTNKLFVALAEAQIIQAKRQRDTEAQAFNDHIRFLSDGKSVMTTQTQNVSSAMLAWRMP